MRVGPILRALGAVTLLAAAPVAIRAQTTHRITLARGESATDFQVKPARTTARAGDVLVFRAAGAGDHSIVFEGGIPTAARAALAAAMPHRVGDLAGPLFAAGSEYRIVLPALPAGEYRFFCLPHRAYDEVGTIVIE